MAENSGISWTHHTQNFWEGCDKVAPECAHCYIDRFLRKHQREPWGQVYRTQTWAAPWMWEAECARAEQAKRVFTCSLSDFFHVKADPWRREAWAIIKYTPHLIWLILTKRPELIEQRLPRDWGKGYRNVFLGVSTGCRRTLNKMDTLRRIPAAVRFVSAEPLLEDISKDINLDGFGWVITGGESGSGEEYVWNSSKDWRSDFDQGGRRYMAYEWAANLRDKTKAAGLPFMFKQVTHATPGYGYNALDGKDWHEFPPPPKGLQWAPREPIPAKCEMTREQWEAFREDFDGELSHNAIVHGMRPRHRKDDPNLIYVTEWQQRNPVEIAQWKSLHPTVPCPPRRVRRALTSWEAYKAGPPDECGHKL